ncbi:2-methylcitrate synthase [Bacteroidales bacterium]|nr:2-methylcitrate synthase [Bacteroidales bacterium]
MDKNKERMIFKLSESIKTTSHIDNDLFTQYSVKRGLRNKDHSGVLVGLTKIGDVVGYERQTEGGLKAIPGKLVYRGIDVEDLVHGLHKENRLGFEETIFLILSGKLPDKEDLETFSNMLCNAMPLEQKVKMNILDLEGNDIMNILSRSVLEMYTFDDKPDDNSRDNLIRQSIDLIAKCPTIIAYAYSMLRHSNLSRSLHIRHPKENVSIADNFLFMLKGPNNYSELDVRILDLSMILHAEHGGGNNSTFTVRVTSSSGTDTYSSIAAGIGSLKGPLHGGANLKVMDQFNHLKETIKDWKNEEEIAAYMQKILNKEVHNKTGLIYGIGHAVYTISDPRAILLKELARELAVEKNKVEEFDFLELLEAKAVEAFMIFKGTKVNKQVCANVDFYSGFVYEMIGLPKEVYTPLFAMSRMVGWAAHRIEELNFESKRIIRPAYKNVASTKKFIPLKDRR